MYPGLAGRSGTQRPRRPPLALCPPGVRVAAWYRGERPTRSRWPLHAWEPVLYHGGRQLMTSGQRRADSLVWGAVCAPIDLVDTSATYSRAQLPGRF